MIDARAVIDDSAIIAEGVEISPFAVIGADVEIGEGTWVGPHAVIKGPTKIGKRNKIHQFSSIGEDPQDLKYAGEPTQLIIGDDNVFREFTTVNRGTTQDEGITRIGNHNLLMAYVHIAHDVVLQDHIICSNGAQLAGHVHVDDHAIISGFALIHQFCRIGQHSFISMGAAVNKDVLPFVTVSGNYAKAIGVNKEGLKRRGFDDAAVTALHQCFRMMFRSKKSRDEIQPKIDELAEKYDEVRTFLDFVEGSERGVVS